MNRGESPVSGQLSFPGRCESPHRRPEGVHLLCIIAKLRIYTKSVLVFFVTLASS